MTPFIITVDPLRRDKPQARRPRGRGWLYGMEGEIEIEYGKELFVLHRVNPFTTIPSCRIRCAHDGQKAKFLAVV